MWKPVPNPWLQAVTLALIPWQSGPHIVVQDPWELNFCPYFLPPDLEPSLRMNVPLLINLLFLYYFWLIRLLILLLGPHSWVLDPAMCSYIFLSLRCVWSRGGVLKHEPTAPSWPQPDYFSLFLYERKMYFLFFFNWCLQSYLQLLSSIISYLSSIFHKSCSIPLSVEIYIWSILSFGMCSCTKSMCAYIPSLSPSKWWSNVLHFTYRLLSSHFLSSFGYQHFAWSNSNYNSTISQIVNA